MIYTSLSIVGSPVPSGLFKWALMALGLFKWALHEHENISDAHAGDEAFQPTMLLLINCSQILHLS